MIVRIFAACALLCALFTVPAEARHRRQPVACVETGWFMAPVCGGQEMGVSIVPERRQSVGRGIEAVSSRAASTVLGGRPRGCPVRYCGCGTSLHLFGRIIPSLNLAANWLRFPRAAPAPGMVAARRGHVFVLKEHVGGSTWRVFDANSGRGKSRIHNRSISGFAVVNPHGAS